MRQAGFHLCTALLFLALFLPAGTASSTFIEGEENPSLPEAISQLRNETISRGLEHGVPDESSNETTGPIHTARVESKSNESRLHPVPETSASEPVVSLHDGLGVGDTSDKWTKESNGTDSPVVNDLHGSAKTIESTYSKVRNEFNIINLPDNEELLGGGGVTNYGASPPNLTYLTDPEGKRGEEQRTETPPDSTPSRHSNPESILRNQAKGFAREAVTPDGQPYHPTNPRNSGDGGDHVEPQGLEPLPTGTVHYGGPAFNSPLIVAAALTLAGVLSYLAYWLYNGLRYGTWALSSLICRECRKHVKKLPEVRKRIWRHINDNPGIRKYELAKQTGMKKRSIRYHVSALRKQGLIDIRKKGNAVFIFPASCELPNSPLTGLKIHPDPLNRALLDYITRNPGATQKEISEAFQTPQSTIHYRMQQLLKEELIRFQRQGREVQYFTDIQSKSAASR